MKSEFTAFLVRGIAFALVMCVGMLIIGIELRIAGTIAAVSGLPLCTDHAPNFYHKKMAF